MWAAHKERGGRALPSAPRPEREPFLPAQRKWRRRSSAPGAHAGVRPGAGRARPAAPPRRPHTRRGPPGRRQPAPFPAPARRPPAYLQPDAASAQAPAGPQTGPWRRRGWQTRSPRAAAGPTPGGSGLHTRRWRQRRDGGAPAPSINRRRVHQSARGVARPPQSSARERGGAGRGRRGAARTRAGRPSLGWRS